MVEPNPHLQLANPCLQHLPRRVLGHKQSPRPPLNPRKSFCLRLTPKKKLGVQPPQKSSAESANSSFTSNWWRFMTSNNRLCATFGWKLAVFKTY